MAFNRETYRRNENLKLAKRAIENGKALRNGTHYLCRVLTPERLRQNIEIAVADARYYRRLAKLAI